MHFTTSLIALAAAITSANALDTVVNVYEGPTECEDKVEAGMHLSMHYVGKIAESSATGEKGSQFDSSRDRGDPFDFQIGGGQVIKGWDEGLLGLCQGAKATLTIPPAEGYGEGGAGGDIPGGATLEFDVEVLSFGNDGPPEPNLFKEIDTNGDGVLDEDEITVYFKGQGMDLVPEELWEHEDADGDRTISWEEFSGPKGTKEEL